MNDAYRPADGQLGAFRRKDETFTLATSVDSAKSGVPGTLINQSRENLDRLTLIVSKTDLDEFLQNEESGSSADDQLKP